jgi:D-tyrosyl-tRNA(Tyr) deacylase
MRVVIQRVTRAAVRVDGETVGSIGPGLLLLVGVAEGDGPEEARRLAQKTSELRIFSDAEGRFNLSLLETGGEALVVSQFTLLADVRKGRRPSFTSAAAPEAAAGLVDAYAEALRELGVRVATGRFGAHMAVELENDGPMTLVIDTDDLDRQRRGGG